MAGGVGCFLFFFNLDNIMSVRQTFIIFSAFQSFLNNEHSEPAGLILVQHLKRAFSESN